MTAPQDTHEWWNVDKHVTYHSIETTSSSKRVDMFANDKLLDKCEWVVTEKIHGSNFSFITNGKQIMCANRLKPLSDSEEFFGFQTVKENYSSNILKSWEIMSSRNLIKETLVSNDSNEKVIIIFGELFGGRYAHPDVNPIESAAMCQFGIDYCPQNEFMAFDIFDGKEFLNYDVMIEVLEESGLPFLKPLFRGSFENAFKYDPEFATTIPSLFGLPPLPSPNKAEGVVIKPVLTLRTTNQKRVILKIIASDFLERVRIQKRQYRKESRQRKKPDELTDELFEEFSTFINENRVGAVVSKFGPIVSQNQDEEEDKLNERINQVANLLYEDALADFNKNDDLKGKFEKLLECQRNIIRLRGNSLTVKAVKKYAKKVKNLSSDSDKKPRDLLVLSDSDVRWAVNYYYMENRGCSFFFSHDSIN